MHDLPVSEEKSVKRHSWGVQALRSFAQLACSGLGVLGAMAVNSYFRVGVRRGRTGSSGQTGHGFRRTLWWDQWSF